MCVCISVRQRLGFNFCRGRLFPVHKNVPDNSEAHPKARLQITTFLMPGLHSCSLHTV